LPYEGKSLIVMNSGKGNCGVANGRFIARFIYVYEVHFFIVPSSRPFYTSIAGLRLLFSAGVGSAQIYVALIAERLPGPL